MSEEPEILDRVVITRPFCGLSRMQVCTVADATDEEILTVCNRYNSAGTTNGWVHVIRETNVSYLAPVQCEDYPERIHFLVEC